MMDNSVRLGDGVRVMFTTSGPKRHFFGYYDKSPIDASGRWLLCHRVDFDGRLPHADDLAELGRYDLKTGEYERLGETRCFNWQQGAMLQWLGPDFSKRVIYNDLVEGDYRSVILDVNTGERQVICRPVYHVRSDGKAAVTLDFRRLYWARPSYAYSALIDESRKGTAPESDGIEWVDLEKNQCHFILRTRSLMGVEPLASMAEGDHYIEHLMFSPNGSRVAFYHRWTRPDGGWWTRLYSMDCQGGELFRYPDSGCYSHGCWRNDRQVMYWCRQHNTWARLRAKEGVMRKLLGPILKMNRKLSKWNWVRKARSGVSGFGYYLFNDNCQQKLIEASIPYDEDGHCSFRPGDEHRFVTDTYPDKNGIQRLLLGDVRTKQLRELGAFYCPGEYIARGFRCDLHPRWDADGERICIDTMMSGKRQMVVLDISERLDDLEK